MIISSLAFVLAAAMPVSPLSNPIHLHPKVKVVDDRISFSLVNPTSMFRDVKVDGQTYTIGSHHSIDIKAPAGTMIYTASPSLSRKRGDVLLVVTPQQNKARISLD